MLFWRYFSFTIDDYTSFLLLPVLSVILSTEIRTTATRKKVCRQGQISAAHWFVWAIPMCSGDVAKLMRSLRGEQKAQTFNAFIRIVTRTKIGTENREIVCSFQCAFLLDYGKHRICIDWQIIESVLPFSLRRDHARKTIFEMRFFTKIKFI